MHPFAIQPQPAQYKIMQSPDNSPEDKSKNHVDLPSHTDRSHPKVFLNREEKRVKVSLQAKLLISDRNELLEILFFLLVTMLC
jgi:hypothetical protein